MPRLGREGGGTEEEAEREITLPKKRKNGRERRSGKAEKKRGGDEGRIGY